MPVPVDTTLAVMLNHNARRVSDRVCTTFQQLVPQVAVYDARTLEEARQQVRDALERGYHDIVCGGGDGTVVHILNSIREYVDEQNARLNGLGTDFREQMDRFRWPRIGILKLGTGNGWAFDVGSRKPLTAMKRMLEHVPTRPFHLLESEHKVFHFSGLGYDAAVLNDYMIFKERFGKGLMAPWFKGLTGYITSLLCKSVPEHVGRQLPQMRLTKGRGPVYAVLGGDTIQPLALGEGETLYEGPVSVTGAGTTHCYGYGMRAFPFASTLPGFFNLRVIRAGVLECLSHAPSIVRGRYRSPNFLDFLAQDVTLEFDRPMPMQIAGDSQGFRDQVRYQIADFAIDVYDLAPA